MQTIAVVGLDLAKTVFQVHGVAADGTVVVRRQLRRGQVLGFFQSIGSCLVGIEACASAHHWARELMAIGHEVRLMPPAYVKAYVKRGKTDAADAEAIAEAVTRPTKRLVAVRFKAQQAVLMLHKTWDLLVRQRTMLINALRGHLGEFGIVAPQGPAGLQTALRALREEGQDLPDLARAALEGLQNSLNTSAQRSVDWNAGFSTGIDRMRRAGGWRPSRASGRSPPAPWQPVRRIRRYSARAGSSRPGWGSRRTPTAVAARNAKAASARWATVTSDAFWSSGRPPSCEWPDSEDARAGSAICSSARSPRSPPWPWPTRPLASPGL